MKIRNGRKHLQMDIQKRHLVKPMLQRTKKVQKQRFTYLLNNPMQQNYWGIYDTINEFNYC